VPRAVAYFEQARAAFATCQPADPRSELALLSNLGNTYLQAGQTHKAARPLRQAQALVQATTSAATRLNLLDLIGMLQLAEHHPDSAAATWQQELRLARAAQDRRSETYALGNLARVRLQQQQPDEALRYVREALRLARALGNQSQLADFTLVQAQVLHALRRLEAFDTLTHYTVLHDTLVGRARTEAIAQQQVRFDLAGQQARIRVLRQERRISQLRAAEQAGRARLYALIAGGLLVVVVGGGALMVLLARSRRRLQTSETALRQANDTQQELMRIIGHDLRGPVGTFQQITPLLHEIIGPAPTADATDLVRELDASAQRLGSLVDNLLHWARMQGGLVQYAPVRQRAATAVHSVERLYAPIARQKGVTLVADVSTDIAFTTDLDLLTTVLRNLLANAIKFTPPGGTVRLSAEADSQTGAVCFAVTDTGVGMPPATLAAFNAATRLTSQAGTAGEPGTGLGLPVCQRFVTLLGGELRAEPNTEQVPGTGMRFWFALRL
jgi:signal transduction histidine kinase